MSRRPGEDDDELEPGVPIIDGDDGAGVEDALDEGIDDEAEESVGLDEDQSVDVGDDDLELDDDAEEGGDWEGGEGAPLEDDEELGGDDEGGWTEGSETGEADPWDDDDEDLRDEPGGVLAGDAGEEGVEESHPSDGDDDLTANLPPPDVLNEEALADDVDLEDDADIDDVGEERERATTERDDAHDVSVRALGPHDDAIEGLALDADGVVWVGGARVYRGALGGTLETIAELDEDSGVAVAALGDAAIVALRGSGLARISRRGAREDVASTLGAVLSLVRDGHTLWARTRGGALVRSEDDGHTWSRPVLLGVVRAVAASSTGGVVAVVGGREGALAVGQASDAGRAFRLRDVSSVRGVPLDVEIAVAAHGDVIVLLVAGDAWLSRDGGASFTPWPGLRGAGQLAILDEGGELVAYAGTFVESLDRASVIRAPIGGEARLLAELHEVRDSMHLTSHGEGEGELRIHEISARRSGTGTIVVVASGLGVVELTIRDRPPVR